MNKNKKFLTFGIILIIIQVLAFIGGIINEGEPTTSTLLIILTVVDFYYYFKKKK